MDMKKTLFTLVLVALAAGGCATNPVTGRSELALVSEVQEIAIGEQQYAPARQMQGGDYTVDPGLTEYVRSVGQRIAAVSDRPLPYEFVVINDSTPNAWALPGGKIAVNRGLLDELENEAELAAVLGHEIVHAAARHGAQAIQRQTLLQGAVVVAGAAAAAMHSDAARAVVGSAALGAQLINQKHGRDAELESDHYGMNYMARAGYDPRAAVTLQEKFVRLAEGREPGWLDGLFASHPPSRERVEANRRHAAELAVVGELGRERYDKAVAQLRRDAPAYEAMELGRRALAEDDASAALAAAEQALRLQPREGLFHALRGDVRFEQARFGDAGINYTRALERNGEFFYFRLKRGLARKAEGDGAGAIGDLEASAALLPTAIAADALGDLYLEKADRARAIESYRRAASSDSAIGRAAATKLARLELAERPADYLPSRLGLSREGELLVEVRNPTPVAVAGIRVEVRYPDEAGQVRSFRSSLEGTLAAGEAGIVRTGFGPLHDTSRLSRMAVAVVAARVAD
jgi:predicted Zn-dependent protease